MDKMTHVKFNLNNFLMAFSLPLDHAIDPNRYNIPYVSRRVSYMALRLAILKNFNGSQKSDIFSYSLIVKSPILYNNFEKIPFNVVSNLDEHLKNIITLALFIEENINLKNDIIINKAEITDLILSNDAIKDEIKELYKILSDDMTFWLDLVSNYQLPFLIFNLLEDFTMEIEYTRLIELAKLFSQTFCEYSTTTYSINIYTLFEEICTQYNMDEKDKARMIISFYLYDSGKLYLPRELFTKTQNLNKYEVDMFQSVPYFTNTILTQIFGFDDINQLSSTCFERLNGKGYPFQLKSNELSLKNRILAIFVRFKALKEEKRYRLAFNDNDVIEILQTDANNGEIDLSILKDIKKLITGEVDE